jgi:hypothetical protein
MAGERTPMNEKRRSARLIAQGAIIAALYVVLTLIFAPISFGPLQLRIAEALTIPFVLRYGYGIAEDPLPLLALYIAAGEVLGCGVLGELLATVLLRRKQIFPRG